MTDHNPTHTHYNDNADESSSLFLTVADASPSFSFDPKKTKGRMRLMIGTTCFVLGTLAVIYDGRGSSHITSGLVSFVSVSSSLVSSSPPSSASSGLLFRDKKFLLAHDAATGYTNTVKQVSVPAASRDDPRFGRGQPEPPIVPIQFVQTQYSGFTDQLNCGARALDLRLGFENPSSSSLTYHHDVYYWSNVTQSDVHSTLPEILTWARHNPTELVVLLLSHCFNGIQKTNCDDKFTAPFTNVNITVVTNRTTLQTMTVAEAEQLAKVNAPPGNSEDNGSGGMVLAIVAPTDDRSVDSTYDAAIADDVTGRATPSADNSNTCVVDYNYAGLWKYTAAQLDAKHTIPYQLQGIWQEIGDVIASYGQHCGVYPQGLLEFSIKKQTLESGINTELANKVVSSSSWFQNGNFLLMNFVGTEGPRIGTAFGATSKEMCPVPPS